MAKCGIQKTFPVLNIEIMENVRFTAQSLVISYCSCRGKCGVKGVRDLEEVRSSLRKFRKSAKNLNMMTM